MFEQIHSIHGMFVISMTNKNNLLWSVCIPPDIVQWYYIVGHMQVFYSTNMLDKLLVHCVSILSDQLIIFVRLNGWMRHSHGYTHQISSVSLIKGSVMFLFLE